jgi:catechol 2,3-dioxygenase-like lactoylglutathione lyase family enzyme
MPVKVNALDHLVINVSDVARSTEWYAKILGMEIRVFDPGDGKTKRTSLVFGNQKINVRPKNADKAEWFTADHEAAGSDDLCFLTSSTPDQVVAHLNAHGVEIEEGPTKKQGARGRPRFSASRFWRVALEHGCTWTSTIPFCMKALLGTRFRRTTSSGSGAPR